MEVTEEGVHQKCVYLALSYVVDNSETILKVFKITFSGFRAGEAVDTQHYNFSHQ